MTEPRARVTPEFLDHIFATKVRRQVFEDAVRPETNRPVMIFVGAQPGAGKTRAMEMAVRDAGRAHPVIISGDDFRQYHPDYRRLIDEDPTRMPAVTAELSGPMVRRSLDHAKQQRYSIALEGTFRDEAMVLATAHEFAQEGYEIHVVAVATQPEVSRLSIEDRYLSAPASRARWTPPTAHDLTIASSGHVLDALEASDVVDRISVYTRAERVYRNERDRGGEWAESPRAREVLEAERARPLSPSASREWLRDYVRVVEEVRQRPEYLGGDGAHTHRQLARDAEQVRAWSRAVDAPTARLNLGETIIHAAPIEQRQEVPKLDLGETVIHSAPGAQQTPPKLDLGETTIHGTPGAQHAPPKVNLGETTFHSAPGAQHAPSKLDLGETTIHGTPNPLGHDHHQPPAVHDPHHGVPGRTLNL